MSDVDRPDDAGQQERSSDGLGCIVFFWGVFLAYTVLMFWAGWAARDFWGVAP